MSTLLNQQYPYDFVQANGMIVGSGGLNVAGNIDCSGTINATLTTNTLNGTPNATINAPTGVLVINTPTVQAGSADITTTGTISANDVTINSEVSTNIVTTNSLLVNDVGAGPPNNFTIASTNGKLYFEYNSTTSVLILDGTGTATVDNLVVGATGDAGTGQVRIFGDDAGLLLGDRTTTNSFQWYSNNDILRAYYGTGDILSITSTGEFTTDSNITSTNGNIQAVNGDFTTTNGEISTTNGDIIATNGNITATAGIISSGGNLIAKSGIITNYVAAAPTANDISGTAKISPAVVLKPYGIAVINNSRLNPNSVILCTYISVAPKSELDATMLPLFIAQITTGIGGSFVVQGQPDFSFNWFLLN